MPRDEAAGNWPSPAPVWFNATGTIKPASSGLSRIVASQSDPAKAPGSCAILSFPTYTRVENATLRANWDASLPTEGEYQVEVASMPAMTRETRAGPPALEFRYQNHTLGPNQTNDAWQIRASRTSPLPNPSMGSIALDVRVRYVGTLPPALAERECA